MSSPIEDEYDDDEIVITCEEQPLSAAQIAYYTKRDKLNTEIDKALRLAAKSGECDLIENSELVQIYDFYDAVPQTIDVLIEEKLDQSRNHTGKSSYGGKRQRHTEIVYTIESETENEDQAFHSESETTTSSSDEDDNVPLAKRRDIRLSPLTTSSPSTTLSTKTHTPLPKPRRARQTYRMQNVAEQAPCESNSLGGLKVPVSYDADLQKGDAAEEVNTYPSLTVCAKPYLRVREAAGSRLKLDTKVKALLSHSAAKFCEWLLKEGLVRTVQHCVKHPGNELILGSYSVVEKFPYTGGYVWLSECCARNFVSVFYNSIFAGANYPPQVVLKIIYHWACLTPTYSIIQWVKCDSSFVKNIFTLLRAICTLSLQQNCQKLGGPNVYVEVGIISIGAEFPDSRQRPVKLQFLGLLDHATKNIRLRTVDPHLDADRHMNARVKNLLEAARRHVHRDSIICLDMSIDKNILVDLGFSNILQASSTDENAQHTNACVMDYLRRIVPRMFHASFTSLSREIIQEFLDELCWRERFATNPLQAFDNIVAHLVHQTRIQSQVSFCDRLQKVASNPFKDWSVILSGESIIPANTTPQRLAEPIDADDYEPLASLLPSSNSSPRSHYTPDNSEDSMSAYDGSDSNGDSSESDSEEDLPLAVILRKKRQKKTAKTEDCDIEYEYVLPCTPPPMPLDPLEELEMKFKEKDYKAHAKAVNPLKEVDHLTDAAVTLTEICPTPVLRDWQPPEETARHDNDVGIEGYYYGICEGYELYFESFPIDDDDDDDELTALVVCPVCGMDQCFISNETLQLHLFSHITTSGKGRYQCIFCLDKIETEDALSRHGQLIHPVETKMANSISLNCIICQNRHNNLKALIQHMQNTHNRHELPYYCQACDYRSSMLRDVISHFYQDHKEQNILQCPFCLEIFHFSRYGVIFQSRVIDYYEHLVDHSKKLNSERFHCARCALRFTSTAARKQHEAHFHQTVKQEWPPVLPLLMDSRYMPIPTHDVPPIDKPQFWTEKLPASQFKVECFWCSECDSEIVRPKLHYTGLLKCMKCAYQTCCERAAYRHVLKCRGRREYEVSEPTLPSAVHCICGFSTKNANQIANHLVSCQKTTCYMSAEAARENAGELPKVEERKDKRKRKSKSQKLENCNGYAESVISDDAGGCSMSGALNDDNKPTPEPAPSKKQARGRKKKTTNAVSANDLLRKLDTKNLLPQTQIKEKPKRRLPANMKVKRIVRVVDFAQQTDYCDLETSEFFSLETEQHETEENSTVEKDQEKPAEQSLGVVKVRETIELVKVGWQEDIFKGIQTQILRAIYEYETDGSMNTNKIEFKGGITLADIRAEQELKIENKVELKHDSNLQPQLAVTSSSQNMIETKPSNLDLNVKTSDALLPETKQNIVPGTAQVGTAEVIDLTDGDSQPAIDPAPAPIPAQAPISALAQALLTTQSQCFAIQGASNTSPLINHCAMPQPTSLTTAIVTQAQTPWTSWPQLPPAQSVAMQAPIAPAARSTPSHPEVSNVIDLTDADPSDEVQKPAAQPNNYNSTNCYQPTTPNQLNSHQHLQTVSNQPSVVCNSFQANQQHNSCVSNVSNTPAPTTNTFVSQNASTSPSRPAIKSIGEILMNGINRQQLTSAQRSIYNTVFAPASNEPAATQEQQTQHVASPSQSQYSAFPQNQPQSNEVQNYASPSATDAALPSSCYPIYSQSNALVPIQSAVQSFPVTRPATPQYTTFHPNNALGGHHQYTSDSPSPSRQYLPNAQNPPTNYNYLPGAQVQNHSNQVFISQIKVTGLPNCLQQQPPLYGQQQQPPQYAQQAHQQQQPLMSLQAHQQQQPQISQQPIPQNSYLISQQHHQQQQQYSQQIPQQKYPQLYQLPQHQPQSPQQQQHHQQYGQQQQQYNQAQQLQHQQPQLQQHHQQSANQQYRQQPQLQQYAQPQQQQQVGHTDTVGSHAYSESLQQQQPGVVFRGQAFTAAPQQQQQQYTLQNNYNASIALNNVAKNIATNYGRPANMLVNANNMNVVKVAGTSQVPVYSPVNNQNAVAVNTCYDQQAQQQPTIAFHKNMIRLPIRMQGVNTPTLNLAGQQPIQIKKYTPIFNVARTLAQNINNSNPSLFSNSQPNSNVHTPQSSTAMAGTLIRLPVKVDGKQQFQHFKAVPFATPPRLVYPPNQLVQQTLQNSSPSLATNYFGNQQQARVLLTAPLRPATPTLSGFTHQNYGNTAGYAQPQQQQQQQQQQQSHSISNPPTHYFTPPQAPASSTYHNNNMQSPMPNFNFNVGRTGADMLSKLHGKQYVTILPGGKQPNQLAHQYAWPKKEEQHQLPPIKKVPMKPRRVRKFVPVPDDFVLSPNSKYPYTIFYNNRAYRKPLPSALASKETNTILRSLPMLVEMPKLPVEPLNKPVSIIINPQFQPRKPDTSPLPPPPPPIKPPAPKVIRSLSDLDHIKLTQLMNDLGSDTDSDEEARACKSESGSDITILSPSHLSPSERANFDECTGLENLSDSSDDEVEHVPIVQAAQIPATGSSQSLQRAQPAQQAPPQNDSESGSSDDSDNSDDDDSDDSSDDSAPTPHATGPGRRIALSDSSEDDDNRAGNGTPLRRDVLMNIHYTPSSKTTPQTSKSVTYPLPRNVRKLDLSDSSDDDNGDNGETKPQSSAPQAEIKKEPQLELPTLGTNMAFDNFLSLSDFEKYIGPLCQDEADGDNAISAAKPAEIKTEVETPIVKQEIIAVDDDVVHSAQFVDLTEDSEDAVEVIEALTSAVQHENKSNYDSLAVSESKLFESAAGATLLLAELPEKQSTESATVAVTSVRIGDKSEDLDEQKPVVSEPEEQKECITLNQEVAADSDDAPCLLATEAECTTKEEPQLEQESESQSATSPADVKPKDAADEVKSEPIVEEVQPESPMMAAVEPKPEDSTAQISVIEVAQPCLVEDLKPETAADGSPVALIEVEGAQPKEKCEPAAELENQPEPCTSKKLEPQPQTRSIFEPTTADEETPEPQTVPEETQSTAVELSSGIACCIS